MYTALNDSPEGQLLYKKNWEENHPLSLCLYYFHLRIISNSKGISIQSLIPINERNDTGI